MSRIRKSTAAGVAGGVLVVCLVAVAAIVLSPATFAGLVLLAAAIWVLWGATPALRSARARRTESATGHQLAELSVRVWGACIVIAVVGGSSLVSLDSAGALAMMSALFLPWFVVRTVMRRYRVRRRDDPVPSISGALRFEETPAIVASVGILVSAFVILELLDGAGHVVNGAVFVSPGAIFLVGLGCLAIVRCDVLLKAFQVSAMSGVAARLAVVSVCVVFVTTAVATAVTDSLVGSAFGFAVGGLAVVVGGYVFAVPWSPTDVLDRVVVASAGVGSRIRSRSAEPQVDSDNAVAATPESDKSAVRRAYLGVCVVIVFAVLVPAYVIGAIPSRSGSLWLLIIPTLVLASLRLAWLVRRGERRLLEMTFWVFTYTFMGLAPLAQIRDHSAPTTVPRPSWDYVPQAALLVFLGAAAFLVGTYLAGRVSRRKVERPPDFADESMPATVSYRKLVLLSVFTVLLNAYYLLHVGIIQFTRSRIEALLAFVNVWSTGSVGILILPATYMSLLVTWIAWMRFRREMQAQSAAGRIFPPSAGRVSLMFAILIGLLLANTMNPISNARYLSGTAMLAAAVAFGLFSTPNRFRVMTITFVLAFVVVFPLADAFRFTDTAEVKTSGPMESLLSADYDSFVQVGNGLLVAARNGIEPGRQFIGVLLWWFPRAMWPNKPTDTGILIAQDRGYPFTNLSAPLWIEFFINGGWILVAVGMAVLGYVFYRWDSAIENQMHHSKMPTVLGSILPFYLLILLRGSLLQAMSYLTFILFFAFLVRAKHSPPEGPFNRRWLPESMRYADIDVRSDAPAPEPERRKVGAHANS